MDQQNFSQNKLKDLIKQNRYLRFCFSFLFVIAIIAVIFFAYTLARDAYYRYIGAKAVRSGLAYEEAYKAAWKNDTYGGKTPQETYEMFLKALKSGDIEEAAKYYYDDGDRINAYKNFKKMQDEGKLQEWINSRPSWDKVKEVEYWDKDGKKFEFEYIQKEDLIIKDPKQGGGFIENKIPAGKYTGEIIFKLNHSANIWKLY